MAKSLLFVDMQGICQSKFAEFISSPEGKTRLDEVPTLAGAELLYCLNRQQIRDSLRSHIPSAIVFHWDFRQNPYALLEEILQDEILSLFPTVLYISKSTPEDVAFFDEYFLKYRVGSTGQAVADSNKILQYLRLDWKPDRAAVILLKNLRVFFNAIHNRKFEVAEDLRQKKLAVGLSAHDRIYLKAMLLRGQKKFSEALSYMSEALKLSNAEQGKLEVRILHLIGNVAFKQGDLKQAKFFLEAAQKLSPHHPRRRLMLGQVAFESGDMTKSREIFLSLYKDWPDYDGLHAPLAISIVNAAKDAADLEHLKGILSALPERRLKQLHKQMKPSNTAVNSAMIKALCLSLFKVAEKSVAHDDYFGAVGTYQHIRKILGPLFPRFQVEIQIRIIESYVLAEADDEAQACYQQLMLVKEGADQEQRLRIESLSKKVRPQSP